MLMMSIDNRNYDYDTSDDADNEHDRKKDCDAPGSRPAMATVDNTNLVSVLAADVYEDEQYICVRTDRLGPQTMASTEGPS